MRINRADTAFSCRPPKAKARGKAEREHLTRVARLGCIVCRSLGMRTDAEIHHIKHQTGIGRKSSDFDTLPLCAIHHRTGGYGVAYHAGPGAWEMTFGRQTELLERVREMLA